MEKYISAVLVVLCAMFCSCNRHEDEPSGETTLHIVESYVPGTVVFYPDDSEWIDKIKGWPDKKFIVNDLSELPDDPLGFSNAYNGINFRDYTLLITYAIRDWPIDTYGVRYYRDNIKGTYNWTIRLGTSTRPDESPEQWYFTRYAILVNKLPADADVTVWISMRALNWEWD